MELLLGRKPTEKELKEVDEMNQSLRRNKTQQIPKPVVNPLVDPLHNMSFHTTTPGSNCYVEKRVYLTQRIVKQVNYSGERTKWLVTIIIDKGWQHEPIVSSSKLYSESEYADAFGGEFPKHEED